MAKGKSIGIIGIIVVLAVLGAAAYFLFLKQPSGGTGGEAVDELASLDQEAIKDDGIDPETVERNSVLYEALAEAGLDDALVDVTKERILIRLEIPAGYSKEATLSYIFGAAAGTEPNAKSLVVQLFEGETPKEQYSVNLDDVRAAADGKLTDEEFSKKVERKEL